ncbi:hypothetical protein [Petroclostridium sp. X23]|uniref:hypothetical protein n=1 Tax=Petroclostridium sp. X23 TaxID=3045146 RepID=UPI0024AE7963|nr:hypothetical protein [Petroclostridium sp. X23]WHH58494.1 hypothetical protein QKW49_22275 [Petroclostridium sp. X23]
MNLSTEKKIHIDSILDDRSLGWLFPVLETGQATCKEFMKLNNEFFNCSDYLNTVPGHLLSYSINRQLSSQCSLPACPFTIHKEKINVRNQYCIPILRKDDITISIMRSVNRRRIDKNDKAYLKEKCRKNNELDGQFSLFEPEISGENNYHGVLLYGAEKDWNGIGFADVVFFDSQLKQIHYSINLMDKLHIYISSMSNGEKEKSILNAQNIIKDVKQQLEG